MSDFQVFDDQGREINKTEGLQTLPVITPVAFYDGFAATTATAVLTTAGGEVDIIKEMSFHNINAAAQTILVNVNRGGTDRIIARVVLAQNYTALWSGELVMEAGDILKLQTTTASAVHSVISGTKQV